MLLNEKPTIGIVPEYIWNERRILDIASSINRRLEAREQIPIEWIDEYNKLHSADKR